MSSLNLEYVLAEDRYYLVSLDRTEAIALPRRLHCSLTEIDKPMAERYRAGPYGDRLLPWPPIKPEED